MLRLFLILGLLIGSISLTYAATLNVPGQYATIQAAISAANPGDTVLVADGTYTGTGNVNLDFGGKNITLASQHGAASTIIDCQFNFGSRGLWFHSGEGAAASLNGFTVQSGNGGSSGTGGGIEIENASMPTIQNCIFTNDQSNAISDLDTDGTVAVSGCTFSNDDAAVYNGKMGAMTLTNCTFTENAGAIINYNSMTVNGCTFTNNTASQYTNEGGGFDSEAGVATVAGCTFSGNSAGFGGGCAVNQGQTTLIQCNFTTNTAGVAGGGLSNSDGQTTLINCAFTGNSASSNGYGGALINGNVVQDPGNPPSGSKAVTVLTNCVFSENSAVQCGAIYNSVEAVYPTANLIATECTFNGNSSQVPLPFDPYGSALCNFGIAVLTDDIFWGDAHDEILNFKLDGAVLSASNCDIQGGIAGTTNLNNDPLFVSAPTNLHLQLTSPCFGKGVASAYDNSYLPYDKDERIRPAPPGIGAYDAPGFLDVPSLLFSTIQAAINVAEVGDTVLVADGTYTGPGNVNLDYGGKAITVMGQDEYSTIIDCQNAPTTRGVIFQSGETSGSVFKNFTVMNANEADGNVGTGGGIFVNNSSSPTIQNCLFQNDAAVFGGGMGINTDSNPHITDCIFDDNQASGNGGAMFIYQNCNPLVVNDVFFQNVAGGGISGNGAGGAMEIYAGSAPIITGCSLSQNSAGSSGGGLHLGASSTATVTNTILYGDTAPDGEIGINSGNSGNTITVNYSDVQQASNSYAGIANINSAPMFAPPINLTGPPIYVISQILSLEQDSPCVGRGIASAPDYLSTDILGTIRLNPPSMGAFEGTAGTATALVSSANPSTYGSTPTFTATVTDTAGSATPTGSVEFLDGMTVLGSVPINGRQAVFSPISLSVGSHTITATYIPTVVVSGGFGKSMSPVLTQAVNSVTARSAVLTITNVRVTASGNTVTVTADIDNTGSATATHVSITRASLPRVRAAAPLPGVPLPFTIQSGHTQPITLTFQNAPTGKQALIISGAASGGLAFSYGKYVSVP